MLNSLRKIIVKKPEHFSVNRLPNISCIFSTILIFLSPNQEELTELLAKTSKRPFHFVRQHEQQYKDEYKGKVLSYGEWIKVLSENQRLLHCPIIKNSDKAVLGKTLDNIDGAI